MTDKMASLFTNFSLQVISLCSVLLSVYADFSNGSGRTEIPALQIDLFQDNLYNIHNMDDLRNFLQSFSVRKLWIFGKTDDETMTMDEKVFLQIVGTEYLYLRYIVVPKLESKFLQNFNLTTFICNQCYHITSLNLPSFPAWDLRELRIQLNTDSDGINMDLPQLIADQPNLEILDLTGARLHSVFGLYMPHHTHLRELILRDNREMYFSGSAVFEQLVNLRVLDLGILPQLDIEDCRLDLKKLETLKIDNGFVWMQMIYASDILVGLDSLTTLQLNDNPFFPGEVLKELIRPVCKTLVNLDIARCSIDSLQLKTFAPCMKLEHLNLRGNRLTHITSEDFQNNLALQRLDLSQNRITYIAGDSFDSLGNLTYLNFWSNEFQCDCKLRGLQKWMNGSDTAYIDSITRLEKCHSPSRLNKTKITDYTMAWIACDNHLEMVLAGLAAFVVLILIISTTLIYRYRYDIEFWWVISMRRKGYRNLEETDEFHAFLSYSSADADLAMNIHNRLESGLEINYRIAIDGRDFVPGEYLADNIAQLMGRSSKIIFLISRLFLEGKWTTYELRMGELRSLEAKQSLIILIFKEEIPDKELPRTLRTLKRHVNYLVWPTEGDKRSLETFWNRLQLGLNKRD